MAPKRAGDYPSLLFVHNEHEFLITTVPDGADVLLHIADRYGRMMLPVSTRVVGANATPSGRPNHRLIGVAMAELRRSVERLAGERFLSFLETPRAAGDFRWTAADLDAAKNIDWSKPAATLVHQGYYFQIGAYVTPERMVILLRDPDGPFDAPMSIPRESMMRSDAKGVDPLDFGVGIMIDRIRKWDAPRTEAFVRETPRLVVDAPALRQN